MFKDHQRPLILYIKFKVSLPFPLGSRCRPVWAIRLTLILLLLITSRFSSEKSSFRRCRVKATFPLSTRSVGCKKIIWQFGWVLVMALLSCNRSSRISGGVLKTELLVSTCKMMTSGFFWRIGIMWWLISAKVAPLKSCTFTTQFFIIDSSDNRVFRYNASTSRPHMFNFLRGGLLYCTIFIRNFTACCFLKKIELLMLFLSVVSYLFINFGGACGNTCTVLFIFNYLLYRTASCRW